MMPRYAMLPFFMIRVCYIVLRYVCLMIFVECPERRHARHATVVACRCSILRVRYACCFRRVAWCRYALRAHGAIIDAPAPCVLRTRYDMSYDIILYQRDAVYHDVVICRCFCAAICPSPRGESMPFARAYAFFFAHAALLARLMLSMFIRACCRCARMLERNMRCRAASLTHAAIRGVRFTYFMLRHGVLCCWCWCAYFFIWCSDAAPCFYARCSSATDVILFILRWRLLFAICHAAALDFRWFRYAYFRYIYMLLSCLLMPRKMLMPDYAHGYLRWCRCRLLFAQECAITLLMLFCCYVCFWYAIYAHPCWYARRRHVASLSRASIAAFAALMFYVHSRFIAFLSLIILLLMPYLFRRVMMLPLIFARYGVYVCAFMPMPFLPPFSLLLPRTAYDYAVIVLIRAMPCYYAIILPAPCRYCSMRAARHARLLFDMLLFIWCFIDARFVLSPMPCGLMMRRYYLRVLTLVALSAMPAPYILRRAIISSDASSDDATTARLRCYQHVHYVAHFVALRWCAYHAAPSLRLRYDDILLFMLMMRAKMFDIRHALMAPRYSRCGYYALRPRYISTRLCWDAPMPMLMRARSECRDTMICIFMPFRCHRCCCFTPAYADSFYFFCCLMLFSHYCLFRYHASYMRYRHALPASLHFVIAMPRFFDISCCRCFIWCLLLIFPLLLFDAAHADCLSCLLHAMILPCYTLFISFTDFDATPVYYYYCAADAAMVFAIVDGAIVDTSCLPLRRFFYVCRWYHATLILYICFIVMRLRTMTICFVFVLPLFYAAWCYVYITLLFATLLRSVTFMPAAVYTDFRYFADVMRVWCSCLWCPLRYFFSPFRHAAIADYWLFRYAFLFWASFFHMPVVALTRWYALSPTMSPCCLFYVVLLIPDAILLLLLRERMLTIRAMPYAMPRWCHMFICLRLRDIRLLCLMLLPFTPYIMPYYSAYVIISPYYSSLHYSCYAYRRVICRVMPTFFSAWALCLHIFMPFRCWFFRCYLMLLLIHAMPTSRLHARRYVHAMLSSISAHDALLILLMRATWSSLPFHTAVSRDVAIDACCRYYLRHAIWYYYARESVVSYAIMLLPFCSRWCYAVCPPLLCAIWYYAGACLRHCYGFIVCAMRQRLIIMFICSDTRCLSLRPRLCAMMRACCWWCSPDYCCARAICYYFVARYYAMRHGLRALLCLLFYRCLFVCAMPRWARAYVCRHVFSRRRLRVIAGAQSRCAAAAYYLLMPMLVAISLMFWRYYWYSLFFFVVCYAIIFDARCATLLRCHYIFFTRARYALRWWFSRCRFHAAAYYDILRLFWCFHYWFFRARHYWYAATIICLFCRWCLRLFWYRYAVASLICRLIRH